MVWDYYSEVIERISIDKVFDFSYPQVQLFSFLKLHSLEIRVALL